jgi:hypothetical protein
MLSRRGFVRLVGGTAALAALPACGDNLHLPSGRFLDDHQWRTLDAATNVILPGTFADPGAQVAGAVRYIDTLLAAFDVSPPAIFAGGPASGREPEPSSTGAATTVFPANAFATFLPLPRTVEIAWRMRLEGTAETPGGAFNDAVLGARTGLRDLYDHGLAALDVAARELDAKHDFYQLGFEDQALAVDKVATSAPEFYRALVEHTLEGTFAAPEYGGNQRLVGWKLARWDGDSVPRGHATFDIAAQHYRDRDDQPTSLPSPGDISEDFDADVLQLLTIAAVGSGGKRFF